MTNVFFTLPLSKFYLINNCIHFIHFVLVPCVYLLNGGGHWTGDGQLVQGKRTGGVKSSPTMFYVLQYSLCSTFLGCNVFSDTRRIVPNGNGWNIGPWVDIILSVVHYWTWCKQKQIHILLSFIYAGRVQFSPLFCMPNVFHQRQLEMNTPQVAWRVSKW